MADGQQSTSISKRNHLSETMMDNDNFDSTTNAEVSENSCSTIDQQNNFQRIVHAAAEKAIAEYIDRAINHVVEQAGKIIYNKTAQIAQETAQKVVEQSVERITRDVAVKASEVAADHAARITAEQAAKIAAEQATRIAAEQAAQIATEKAAQFVSDNSTRMGNQQNRRYLPEISAESRNFLNSESNQSEFSDTFQAKISKRGTSAGIAKKNWKKNPYDKGLRDTAYFMTQMVNASKENVAMLQQRKHSQ